MDVLGAFQVQMVSDNSKFFDMTRCAPPTQ